MNEGFWYQAAGLFWISVCFFRVGARLKHIPMTARTWWEIGQGAVIVVVLFGLVSEGRGCRSAGPESVDADCVAGEQHC